MSSPEGVEDAVAGRSHRRPAVGRDRLTIAGAALFVAVFTLFQILTVLDRQPMSYIDENVHFDTALKLDDGQIAHRGDLVNMQVVREWVCGVGHQAGELYRTCDDPAMGPADLLSGKYTTGYIHYPTWFLGADAFRWTVDTVAGPRYPLSTYRLFSTLLLSAGLVACGVVAWRLGLRGAALLAAVAVPAAASETVRMGVIVNPSSAAILCGALIAGASIHWLRTGRGFVWLFVVTAFSAWVAVVASLPAGATLLAAIVAWLGQRRGWAIVGGCRPRLAHIGALAFALVLPIVAWGQYISAHATIPNSVLYDNYEIDSVAGLVGGLFGEAARLHSPWSDSVDALTGSDTYVAKALRDIGGGIPVWITVLVFGSLVVALCTTVLRRRAADDAVVASTSDEADEGVDVRMTWLIDPTLLLAACAIAGLVLYPVALRLSNAMTFGIDTGIVSRYSIAFAPLMLLLSLMLVPSRRFAGLLAVLGVVGALALTTTFA